MIFYACLIQIIFQITYFQWNDYLYSNCLKLYAIESLIDEILKIISSEIDNEKQFFSKLCYLYENKFL